LRNSRKAVVHPSYNHGSSRTEEKIWSAAFMPLHRRYDESLEEFGALERVTLKRPEGRAPVVAAPAALS
jgi:hypothetical protein